MIKGLEKAEIILSVLFLIISYPCIWQLLTKDIHDRKSIRAAGAVLAIIFTIVGGTFASISFMMDSFLYMLALTFTAAIFLSSAMMILFFSKNRGSIRRIGHICFFCSLLAILTITLFTRNGDQDTSIRMEFLWAYSGDENAIYWWHHALLNAALFAPFGASLYLLGGKNPLTKTQGILVGMMLSTLIELLQLIFHLGQCDINDIMFNTLGTATGFLCAVASLKHVQLPEKNNEANKS